MPRMALLLLTSLEQTVEPWKEIKAVADKVTRGKSPEELRDIADEMETYLEGLREQAGDMEDGDDDEDDDDDLDDDSDFDDDDDDDLDDEDEDDD